MIKVFEEKLCNANASNFIELKLSKPDFRSNFYFNSDPSMNYIWIAKAKSIKSHYNIAYSCNTKNKNEDKSKQTNQAVVSEK